MAWSWMIMMWRNAIEEQNSGKRKKGGKQLRHFWRAFRKFELMIRKCVLLSIYHHKQSYDNIPYCNYHLLSRIFRFLPIVYQIESKSKLKPRGSSNDRFGSNTGAVLLLEIIYGMIMLWRWYEKKKDANQRTEISLTWNACNTRSLETNFISHVEQNDEI